jgi:hypothetical protein
MGKGLQLELEIKRRIEEALAAGELSLVPASARVYHRKGSVVLIL